MSTITWQGTTSSAWGTGTNWSGGSEPSTGDTVYIDGAVSIDGVDKSAVNLAALIIRETYTGQFGTSAANPVKVACAGECSVLGGSAVYLNSGGSNPIVNLVVTMPTPDRVFDLGGTVTYGAIHRGTVTSAATFTNSSFEPLDGNPLNLPNLTFTGGTHTVGDLINVTAKVVTATTMTTSNCINSVIWNYALTCTTANLIGKRTEFKHYNTATITTVEIKDGAFFNGSVDRRTKTVSNVILHKGGRVAAGNITLTNGVKTPARLTATEYSDAGSDGNQGGI